MGKDRFLLSTILYSRKGFTLLEVLVATAILAIALTVILQLFSSNLRALSVSGNFVSAVSLAESRMREILDDNTLTEKTFSEITRDGYRIDVSIADSLQDRTENLKVKLLAITLKVSWEMGTKQRSLTLQTLKAVDKKI